MKYLVIMILMSVSLFSVAEESDLKIEGGVQLDDSAELDENASIGID